MHNNIDFAAHMEAVALDLLGQPSSKHGNEWRYGRNGSLSIDIKRGTFFNHETGVGGGVVELIRCKKPDTDAITYLSARGCIEALRPNGQDAATPEMDIPYDPANDPFKGVKFKKDASRQYHIVRTWAYVDEAGEELFEVCRLETEAGAKTYRQRHKGADGEYIDNVKGIRQVPYRLPELIESIALDKIIFITEGEKCADAVIAIGGAATTNAMGAGKWPDALTAFFGGANVCILPDNDEPGKKHAALVAARLSGAARRVRILELPDLPPKGDVAD